MRIPTPKSTLYSAHQCNKLRKSVILHDCRGRAQCRQRKQQRHKDADGDVDTVDNKVNANEDKDKEDDKMMRGGQ
jgi:hypothetical protein